jgi:membrane fusion protein (multidrug efflux system)
MAMATNRTGRQEGNRRADSNDPAPNDNDAHGPRKGDENDARQDQDDKKKGPSPFKNPWVRIGLVVVVVLLVAGGVIWWLIARHYEDTDDAFIDTHIVRLAPQIAGQVTAVLAQDNQLVRQGDLLIAINSSDAQTRLDQILAQKAQAQTTLAQALAGEAGAAAQAQNANRDFARYVALKKTAPAAVAQQQMDQAQATARNANAQRAQTEAQIAGARAQIKSYDAQIAAARLSLGYTRIAAPITGHVAQKTVAVGDYVSPGQQLLAIVPLRLWVTANFKETQLELMRVGQHVDVTIDACGLTLPGHVDSIQRGAGQAFGILPPENATGNYVKVVQRVPVKIVLDRLPDPRRCPLGPGMSVEPTVTVR